MCIRDRSTVTHLIGSFKASQTLATIISIITKAYGIISMSVKKYIRYDWVIPATI